MKARELIASLEISPDPDSEVRVDVFDSAREPVALGCSIERVSLTAQGVYIAAVAAP